MQVSEMYDEALKLRKRIPEYEKHIAKNALHSYWYARSIAKERVLEFESGELKNDALLAFWYCCFIAKCRISEFEPVILKSRYAREYLTKICGIPEEEAKLLSSL
jgi:hypothetical protein